jgi:hypothetical protein
MPVQSGYGEVASRFARDNADIAISKEYIDSKMGN